MCFFLRTCFIYSYVTLCLSWSVWPEARSVSKLRSGSMMKHITGEMGQLQAAIILSHGGELRLLTLAKRSLQE